MDLFVELKIPFFECHPFSLMKLCAKESWVIITRAEFNPRRGPRLTERQKRSIITRISVFYSWVHSHGWNECSCMLNRTWFPVVGHVSEKLRWGCAYGTMELMSMNYTITRRKQPICMFFALLCVILARRYFIQLLMFFFFFLLRSQHFFCRALHQASWGLKLIYSTVNHIPWQQPHVTLIAGLAEKTWCF